MDARTKEQIAHLRANGESYTRIAEILHLSVNSIKSFCRRYNVSVIAAIDDTQNDESKCKFCEKPLIYTAGEKRKLFCSEQCRMAWWKENRNTIKQTAWYEYRCGHCHKTFRSYGNKHRRFCSHSCYIHSRFGRSSS